MLSGGHKHSDHQTTTVLNVSILLDQNRFFLKIMVPIDSVFNSDGFRFNPSNPYLWTFLLANIESSPEPPIFWNYPFYQEAQVSLSGFYCSGWRKSYD